ncbi:MAG TPA: carboxypeptidase regulatory-like domain-containing protein [Candidatus Acidoferrales bacterium]|nr:carboxypeptidase regulatory-like domain-containing protein [Candidatus Acidoferrales bacterium]
MKPIRTDKWASAAMMPAVLGVAMALMFAPAWTARRQANGAGGGGISGKILFRGDKPKLLPLDMRHDPVCAAEHEGTVYAQDGAVNDNGTLPNAFVYIKSGTGRLPEAPPRNSVDLTQQGCMYEPHVLGIMVGQPLQVQTLDPTTHNIHVVGDANRDWNVTQQPGSPSVIRRFARSEVMIPVHCNEHPWMQAYIGVVSNPFYAVTGSDGSYTLKGMPPGEYTVAVWTATFGTQEQKVTVREGEAANLDFTFSGKQ